MAEPAAFSQVPQKPNEPIGAPAILDASTVNKARWCRHQLATWYDQHGRQFPWRSSSADLFQQVVSEILLQRTHASTVGQFGPPFFRRFRSWNDINAVPTVRLEEVLRPIGLWRRRASALKALARMMVERAGVFPASRDELESLPGVGQYVASSVLLFAYRRAEPLLDGNMARVIERVFEPRRLVDIRYDSRLQAIARFMICSRDPVRSNWALLDVAAAHCVPRGPKCVQCPLMIRCNYATANRRPEKKGT